MRLIKDEPCCIFSATSTTASATAATTFFLLCFVCLLACSSSEMYTSSYGGLTHVDGSERPLLWPSSPPTGQTDVHTKPSRRFFPMESVVEAAAGYIVDAMLPFLRKLPLTSFSMCDWCWTHWPTEVPKGRKNQLQLVTRHGSVRPNREHTHHHAILPAKKTATRAITIFILETTESNIAVYYDDYY